MYTVRLANEQDYPGIGKVLFNSYRPYFQPGTNIQKRKRDITDVAEIAKTAVIVVAVKNNQIVGCGAVELSNNLKYPEFPEGSAYIRSVAVDAQSRRQGIAKAILDKIREMATEVGKESLILRTAENMKEAQRLYESYGFVRLPKTDWIYPNSGLRLLTYFYPLNGN